MFNNAVMLLDQRHSRKITGGWQMANNAPKTPCGPNNPLLPFTADIVHSRLKKTAT